VNTPKHFNTTVRKFLASSSSSSSTVVQATPMDCSTAMQIHRNDSIPPQESPLTSNIDSLLIAGEVLLIADNYKSLELPNDFWSSEHTAFPPEVSQLIESDFDWQ
jgi:hypothetical protein